MHDTVDEPTADVRANTQNIFALLKVFSHQHCYAMILLVALSAMIEIMQSAFTAITSIQGWLDHARKRLLWLWLLIVAAGILFTIWVLSNRTQCPPTARSDPL